MRNRFRAFWSLDVSIGLGLIAVLSLAMTAVVSRQNAATRKLAETRAGMRQAEQILADLQIGDETTTAGDAEWEFHELKAIDASSAMKWVCVSVKRDGKVEELIGIVPASTERPRSTTRDEP